jgi:hypothetical protein
VKHIDNTVSKANRTMGFIRRNLRDCTKPVKAAAYTTMARPTLEYASTLWDPHSSAETHKLEQVQRRAARFVHNNYTERTPGCVTHMVQNLGWLMYDLEHYDETVVISSLLKWLPAKILYHMRHAARCALRVVVVDTPSGSPLHLL